MNRISAWRVRARVVDGFDIPYGGRMSLLDADSMMRPSRCAVKSRAESTLFPNLLKSPRHASSQSSTRKEASIASESPIASPHHRFRPVSVEEPEPVEREMSSFLKALKSMDTEIGLLVVAGKLFCARMRPFLRD